MPNNDYKIQLENLGNIDWNNLNHLSKEDISETLNSIWSKVDVSADGKLDASELETLKTDLAQAIADKKITKEEAKAYLKRFE